MQGKKCFVERLRKRTKHDVLKYNGLRNDKTQEANEPGLLHH